MDYEEALIAGEPVESMTQHLDQDFSTNCAVAAETSIINTYLENDITLQEANQISASNGWWEPGVGTMPDEIGNLMEYYDIPNHTEIDATMQDLIAELQQGHGVIVGVNSSELWGDTILDELKQFLMEITGLEELVGADHAVSVIGVDCSDPENPMVIINDSGAPDGAGKPYPLEKFKNAWENSGFYYTATDSPMFDRPYCSETDSEFGLAEFLKLAIPILTLAIPLIEALSAADWDEIL